jgi:hypothetical protein
MSWPFDVGSDAAMPRIPPPGYGVSGVPYDPHGATRTGASPSSSSNASTIAKVAIVVGGIVALYLIFKMSEAAKPVAKKLGGVGVKILEARSDSGKTSSGDVAALLSSAFGGRGSGNSGNERVLKPLRRKIIATNLGSTSPRAPRVRSTST